MPITKHGTSGTSCVTLVCRLRCCRRDATRSAPLLALSESGSGRSAPKPVAGEIPMYLPSGTHPIGRHLRDRRRGACEAARRLTHMAAEGGAERACRAVADASCNLVERDFAATKEVLGNGHAPGQQILHGPEPDRAGEAVEKGGAGHPPFPRQFLHRP